MATKKEGQVHRHCSCVRQLVGGFFFSSWGGGGGGY